MDIYSTVAITDNFDIEFTDNGFVRMSENSQAVADRLKLELSSNSNWVLDNSLGMDWVNDDNNGMLQIKNPEAIIVMSLEKKINEIAGVKEVVSISLSPVGDRAVNIDIVVKTTENEEIKVTKEVRDGY